MSTKESPSDGNSDDAGNAEPSGPMLEGNPILAAAVCLPDGSIGFWLPPGVPPFEAAQMFQRAHDTLLLTCNAKIQPGNRVIPVGAGVPGLIERGRR